MPFTARIERALLHRARSASKKGTGRSLPILLRPRVARVQKIIRLHPSYFLGRPLLGIAQITIAGQ